MDEPFFNLHTMEIKRPTLTDYLNYKNVRDYVQGTFNYFFEDNLPSYKKEQAFYRAFLCSPCLTEGRCSHCGCSTPHLFFAPNKSDAQDKWGPMIEEKEWEEFKKENIIDTDNIRIIVTGIIKENDNKAKRMKEEMPELESFAPVPEYTNNLKEILKEELIINDIIENDIKG
jgi:hypothetical protein